MNKSVSIILGTKVIDSNKAYRMSFRRVGVGRVRQVNTIIVQWEQPQSEEKNCWASVLRENLNGQDETPWKFRTQSRNS